MALRISTHKGHRITSQMLNDRVTDVVGGNALMSGFEVSIIATNQVKASAGKCIISGAIIEDDSPRVFTFDSIMLAQQEAKLLIKYNHLEGTVTTHIRAWNYELAEDELLIGTAKLENNSVVEVIQAPYTMTLDELNSLMESIEDKWSNSPNSVVETKEARLEGTITGEIENLAIKGQTYFNLVDEDNIERPVCGELVTAEACSHKISDSKSGAVNAVIAGRTLQNILILNDVKRYNDTATVSVDFSSGEITVTNSSEATTYGQARARLPLIKPSTKYTLVYEIKPNNSQTSFIGIYDNTTNESICRTPNNKTTGVITFETPSDTNGKDFRIRLHVNDSTACLASAIFKVLILEGDHTNTPIEELPYIQGIQSVGDKIEKIFDGKLISGRLDNNGQWYEDSVPTTTTEFIKISPSKSYIISKNGVAQQSNVFLYDENKNFIKKIFSESGEFDATSASKYVRLYWNRTTVELTDRIQVDEGNTVIPYEHYNKYNIEVKSVGKNLFNNKLHSKANADYSIDGNNITITGASEAAWNNIRFIVDVKRNTDYYFNFECSDIENGFITCRQPNTMDLIKDFSTKGAKFNSGDNSQVLFLLHCSLRTPIKTSVTYSNIQLEEGTTATPYEPYQESTTSHILNEPLRRLPDNVRDEIIDNKLIRRVSERVFDGSENWTINTSVDAQQNTLLFDFLDNSSSVKLIEWSVPQNNICSFVPSTYLSREYVTMNDIEGFCTVNNTYRFRIKKSRLSTQDVNGFKALLRANPVTVLCELAMPIITPIDNDVVLPNGVHDEIVDDKVVRKIGKITLNGSENWIKNDRYSNDSVTSYWIKAYKIPGCAEIDYSNNTGSILSDTLNVHNLVSGIVPPIGSVNINTVGVNTGCWVMIASNIIDDIESFKKWLAQNPTTIWYELANPYTERTPIETPLSMFAGTTYITSKNVVMPKIKIDSVGTRYDVPLLKPSTGYTIKASVDAKANLGGEEKTLINGVAKLTTPAVLTDKSLLLSGWGMKAKDVMVFEGNADCHGYVEGIESVGNINSPVLPNGIKDELIGNEKMIQRVGKVVLDGSEEWVVSQINLVTSAFFINMPDAKITTEESAISDKFSPMLPSKMIGDGRYDYEGVSLNKTESRIYIRIKNSKLDEVPVSGNATSIKKWLSENPTTVWYELAKPTEKTCFDWKVEVKSSNKNLFDSKLEFGDISMTTGNTTATSVKKRIITVDFIKIKSGTTYRFTRSRGTASLGARYYDCDKQYISSKTILRDTALSGSFETPINCHYVRFVDTGEYDDLIVDYQLEEGIKSSEFIPHKSSLATYNLTEPLRSLPRGVRDEVVGNTIIRRVGKVVFNGNEDWNAYSDTNNDFNEFSGSLNTPEFYEVNSISDIIPQITNHRIVSTPSGVVYVRLPKSYISSLEDAKAWLRKNPVTVYYPLKTSVVTPLNANPVLPNRVHDEIVDGKTLRRVGKFVVDNNSIFHKANFIIKNGYASNYCPLPNTKVSSSVICNKLDTISKGEWSSITREGVYCGESGNLGIVVSLSKLNTHDHEGFIEWISKNPLTVYYELVTPITEDIPRVPVELKSYEEITHILSLNNVSPLLSFELPTNLSKVINQNSKRLSALEDLIDGMIIPGVIDTDYRNVLFEFNYGMDKMNLR